MVCAKKRISIGITLNVMDKSSVVVISKVVIFAHLDKDDEKTELYKFKSGGNIELFSEEKALENYILTRIKSNGIHYIYKNHLEP